jgi:hypothetical protein
MNRTVYIHELLVAVIIAHQRTNSDKCACGWSMLGASHAEHIAEKYEAAVGP